ncbi:MAG: hypothetical protein H6676_12705, partial [Thermoflexaceae bacterium]|nr:hypothetical protein [Thermoflexaceae bacterium]
MVPSGSPCTVPTTAAILPERIRSEGAVDNSADAAFSAQETGAAFMGWMLISSRKNRADASRVAPVAAAGIGPIVRLARGAGQQRALVGSLAIMVVVAGLVATLTIEATVAQSSHPKLKEAIASVVLFRPLVPHVVQLNPWHYVTLVWLALLFQWVVYLSLLWRLRARMSMNPRLVAIGAVVLGLFAVVTPPALSSDVFMYAIFGRIGAVYDLNPYLHSANAAASTDAMFPLAAWPNIPTPYGPIWTLVSQALAMGHGSTPLDTVLRFKLLAFTAVLVDGFLIYVLVRRRSPESAPWAYAAFAWNPLVLAEGGAAAHNDALILCLVLTGILALGRSWGRAGVAGLTLAALVKYTTLPLLVVATLPAIKRTPGRRRLWMLLQFGLIVLLIAWASFLPFLTGGGNVLLSAAAEPGRGVNNPLSIGLKGAVSLATGGVQLSARSLAAIALLVFGGWLVRSTWERWRAADDSTDDEDTLAASASACLLFLVLWPRIHTWYFLIPLGLAAAA